ncbi:MAG: hypothetical protein CSA50_01740 [Gammaproteobacteria bacterium]|nr:MAG: hypothetical protein CSA50_01740 [Gammaproteobacteria bacterium]
MSLIPSRAHFLKISEGRSPSLSLNYSVAGGNWLFKQVTTPAFMHIILVDKLAYLIWKYAKKAIKIVK